MKLITSTNKKYVSNLIRWFTDEPESHFLFVFDDSLVFHSNFLGVGLQWYDYFVRNNELVWIFNLPLPLSIEEEFYRSFVDKYYGEPYDFKAAMYLGYRCLLYRYWGYDMPKENPWGRGNHYFCSELALKPEWDLIKPGLKEKLTNLSADLVTPGRVRYILQNELSDMGEIVLCP